MEDSNALTVEQLAAMIGCKIIDLQPGAAMVLGFSDEEGANRRWFCAALPESLQDSSDEEVAEIFTSGRVTTKLVPDSSAQEYAVKLDQE